MNRHKCERKAQVMRELYAGTEELFADVLPEKSAH
jgi:hypothetical protein